MTQFGDTPTGEPGAQSSRSPEQQKEWEADLKRRFWACLEPSIIYQRACDGERPEYMADPEVAVSPTKKET